MHIGKQYLFHLLFRAISTRLGNNPTISIYKIDDHARHSNMQWLAIDLARVGLWRYGIVVWQSPQRLNLCWTNRGLFEG